MRRLTIAAAVAVLAIAGTTANDGWAHKGEDHGATVKAKAKQKTPVDQALPTAPFPTNIGGEFELVDHNGQTRRLADFSGKPVAIFFGYTSCEAICSVALPRMVDMVDILDAKGIEVQPVLITVDPKRDTPDAMRKAVPQHHARLVGLTGDDAALQKAYKAFQVESKVVYTAPDGGDIFAHGSYIYLMGRDGKFLTLFPPILGPERMAEIAEKYL